jgi:hypothetical protein
MFAHRTLAVLFGFGALALCLSAGSAQDKKPEEKKGDKKAEEVRKGTVTGQVTAKGENWIELKADGEERARRYTAQWRSMPGGGGPDKETVALIKETPLNSRVKLDWEFDERARVMKIEILKKPGDKKPEEKK